MKRTFVGIVVLILAGCESPVSLEEAEVPECAPHPGPAAVVEYGLVDLPYDSLWYLGTPLQSFDDYPQDEDGVILFSYNRRQHYNPVQIAQRGMWFGENYRRTRDLRYLERSEAHARRLMADAVEVEGALYLPYRFDYRLHGKKDQVMRAPWYSGMAQGQALSLFLRLHDWTGREAYREAADGLMRSFLRLDRVGEPSIARLDCEGYYWIEEYPMVVSTKTLNGFIFALYGVYEYWWVTGDDEAERLVRASLATLKRYLPEFRDPGDVSYYCLKHRVQYPRYHAIHIAQFRYVHRFTLDPFFEEMADQLANDFTYDGT